MNSFKLAECVCLPIVLGVVNQHSKCPEDEIIHVSFGFVCNLGVIVLRDTSYSNAVIKSSLVQTIISYRRGTYIHLTEQLDVFKISHIWVNTPYSIDEVEDMPIGNPICELVPRKSMGSVRKISRMEL